VGTVRRFRSAAFTATIEAPPAASSTRAGDCQLNLAAHHGDQQICRDTRGRPNPKLLDLEHVDLRHDTGKRRQG
jgi:hypothetical protein